MNKNNISFYVLRIGIGITFITIGIMILNNPISWGAMISPKILTLLPAPLKTIMINTAVLDITVGTLLIISFIPLITFIASIIGSIHLVAVLIATGIDAITVRDIGLLGGTLSVALKTLPEKLKFF